MTTIATLDRDRDRDRDFDLDPDLDLDPDVGLGGAALDRRRPVPAVDLTDRSASVAAPARGRAARGGHLDATPPLPAVHVVAALVPDPPGATPMTSWLTPHERAAAEARGRRGQAAHIMGRVAAKQAIQALLHDAGFAAVGAHRIQITNDELGCPRVAVRAARVATRNLRISIAHSGAVAVGAATLHGLPIGIDVEPVEPRSPRFENLTLTGSERALRPVAGDDRDTWLTRLWAAKEATAKATGRGLEGRPKAFAATAIDGPRLRIGARWITTEVVRFGGAAHVIALTEADRTECSWHRS